MQGLRMALYKIKRFIQNVWFFRRELKDYEDFDYQGLLMFNKRCLEGMYTYQSNVDYFVSVNRDNHCKHMKRVIGRLERLVEDEYDTRNLKMSKPINTRKALPSLVKDKDLPTKRMVNKHADAIRQDDLKAIGKFWERYLLHCWH